MHHRAHLEIKIVSTPEEQLQAFAVRALVYMGEQNCPWAEEFDCNDYTATQVLGTIGGEPVVTARIRWFGTFAKLERLAVRAQYRGAGYGCALLEFLIDLCREKGFAQVYLHAQTRLQRFYEKSGFRRVGKPFCFSDHTYVEMLAAIDPKPQAVALAHGPHVINRVEGAWNEEGVLEKSASRSLAHLKPFNAQNKSPSLVASYR